MVSYYQELRLSSSSISLKKPQWRSWQECHKLHSMTTPTTPAPHDRRWLLVVSGLALLIALLGTALAWVLLRPTPPYSPLAASPSIVPANIRNTVAFSIPYPDPAKLPAGYHFDTSSFSATSQVVLYSITYGSNRHIAFSVQAKPSDSELDDFIKTRLPTHDTITTDIGPAAAGSSSTQLLASIPMTQGGAWILVTAPVNLEPADFQTILKSLRL